MIKGVHYVKIKRAGRVPRWYIYAFRGGPLVGKCDGVMRPRLDRKTKLDLVLTDALYYTMDRF